MQMASEKYIEVAAQTEDSSDTVKRDHVRITHRQLPHSRRDLPSPEPRLVEVFVKLSPKVPQIGQGRTEGIDVEEREPRGRVEPPPPVSHLLVVGDTHAAEIICGHLLHPQRVELCHTHEFVACVD